MIVHQITFVYPNNDTIVAKCDRTDSLLQIGNNVGIDFCAESLGTCRVQIQAERIKDPTQLEMTDFSIEDLQKGYRYAHTYYVDQNMYVFLKLVRIFYVNIKGDTIPITAYADENIYDLHRRSRDIDMHYACCGQLACGTCKAEIFSPDEAVLSALGSRSEEEEDWGWFDTPHSRLSCQCTAPLIADNKLTIMNGELPLPKILDIKTSLCKIKSKP